MVKDEEEEALKKRYAEEALDRKTKATLQWYHTCTVKMFNNFVKRESTIKNATCKKCGKTFKTNKDNKLCFECEKKLCQHIFFDLVWKC